MHILVYIFISLHAHPSVLEWSQGKLPAWTELLEPRDLQGVQDHRSLVDHGTGRCWVLRNHVGKWIPNLK